jgi:hypothetical protein
MGISEAKGYDAIDALAGFAEPILEIAQDEDVMALLKDGDGKSTIERLAVAVPKILKNHREAVVQLLAAYKNIPVEEYAEAMTVQTILADAYELATDKDLLSFLG